MNETVRMILDKVKSGVQTVGEATSRTWDSAKNKTSEIWEVTKLNLHIGDLEDQIEKIYKDIGSLVYEAYLNPNTDTEHVDGLLETISEKKESINQLREKVAELRQIKYCPRCSKHLNREDEYCRFCGEKL